MPSQYPHYDSQLQELLDATPEIERASLLPEGLSKLRQNFVSSGSETLCEGREITATEWMVPARDGHSLATTTLRRKGSTRPKAALFHIHSGGMVAGDRLIGMELMADWVEEFDLECASVEYRLAPENPDPLPIHDCYDALLAFSRKVAQNDPNIPLIVLGMSAGGGLAAGLTLMARDLGGPKISAQMLMCPMLDDSNDTGSSRQFPASGLWDRQSNDTGWNALLGERRHTDDVTPYAAPARAANLSDLPPTFLDVGALEVFRSEIADFAERLALAEVPVEFHLWAGAFHGFDLTFPDADVSQQAVAARRGWLQRVLGGNIS
jgi:acetyl esterase/lipase